MSVILNIILAIIALVFFFKFVRYKKLTESEFDIYEERIEDEVSKRKEAEFKHQSETHYLASGHVKNDDIKNSDQTVSSLLAEIETLRKEKEEELKLRFEAEKQIELALQKTTDAENRIQDWEAIQSSNLQNTQDVINNATEDLYHKLANFLEEKISANSTSSISKSQNNNGLEPILKSAGLESGVNYFMNYSISEEVRKSVPCEAFIVFGEENCAIIDNKSTKFFQELLIDKTKNDQEALENFQKKIDRYLTYLTNPKYRSNVVNYFAMNKFISPKANSTLVMLVNSENDVSEFKKLGESYSKILQKNHISLYSLGNIIDLVKAPL